MEKHTAAQHLSFWVICNLNVSNNVWRTSFSRLFYCCHFAVIEYDFGEAAGGRLDIQM